jgi:hypothetical protein
LPREGTSDRESISRVTAWGVEAVLAAFAVRALCEKPQGTYEAREATGVSELVAFQVSWAWMGCRGIGTKTPPRARRSTKRFGRRENARFSGAGGCTLSGVHAGRKS